MTASARSEAALWRARLEEEPQLAFSDDYLKWSADPQNRRLAEEAEDAWSVFDDVSAEPEMLRLRQAALADARRGSTRRWAPSRVAAAIAAGLCLTAVSATAWGLSPKVYRTDVGERRVVLLEDGSRISLDAASEVRVRYTRGERKLELAKGQARFDVARDLKRPFVVDAGDRHVAASNGAFNIDRAAQKVCVTLLNGAAVVRLDPGFFRRAPTGQSTLLKAGQQMTLAARTSSIVPADVGEATAWERGSLLFTDEPLVDVVTRVNRYSKQPIEVAPDAAAVRVSGAFNAGDTDAFLDAMAAYFRLDAAPDADGNVVLQRRSSQR
jgi:transmembrane sensor